MDLCWPHRGETITPFYLHSICNGEFYEYLTWMVHRRHWAKSSLFIAVHSYRMVTMNPDLAPHYPSSTFPYRIICNGAPGPLRLYFVNLSSNENSLWPDTHNLFLISFFLLYSFSPHSSSSFSFPFPFSSTFLFFSFFLAQFSFLHFKIKFIHILWC